jgi:PAS domain S-box-containing protein
MAHSFTRTTEDPELSALRKRIEELEQQLAQQQRTGHSQLHAAGEGIDLGMVREISSVLVQSSTSGEVLDRVIDIAPHFIPADAYAAWRRRNRDGAWVMAASAGVSEQFARENVISSAISSPGEFELRTEALIFEDIDRDPFLASRRPFLQSEGIRSMLVIPFCVAGETSGTVVFYWRTPHSVTAAETRAGMAVGFIAATALTGAEIIERRTTELNLITESIPALISYVDTQQRFLRVNHAYEEMFGLDRQDILGRTIAEVVGPEHYQVAKPYLRRALRGEHLRFRSRVRRHDGQLRDIELSYTPDLAMDGTVRGILVMVHDITDRKQAEEASSRLSAIVDSSDDAIVSKTLDGVITSWNAAAERVFGYTAAEAVGQNITLIIPEDRRGEEAEVLARLRLGRKLDHFETIRRTKDGRQVDISLTVSPVRDVDGRIIGASKIARDITDRKRSENTRAQLAAIVDSSDDAIVGKTLDGVITSWNRAAERIFGYTAAEAVGRHITLIIPEDRRAEEDEVLARIRVGEKVDHFDTERQTKDGRRINISLTVSPVRNASGVIIGASKIARDITDKRRSEERLIANERYLQAVLDSMPECLKVLGPDGTVLQMNRAGLRMLEAESPEQVLGSCIYPVISEQDREAFRSVNESVFRGGSGGTLEFTVTGLKGAERVFETNVVPLLNAQDRPVGALSVTRDITESKRAEAEKQALLAREKKARETAELLNRVGPILLTELDPQNLAQKVTDLATQAVHAEFGAFFYNAVDETGESYVLYTLSGAPLEAFESFPMPRNTPLFGPIFRGEGPVRIDDVTKNPRFGKNPPYHGMPEGHLPVSSYLAIPVVSRTGVVLGGLFFGHSQAAVFTEEAEQIASGIAAQAAIALDNASLFAESKHSQAALLRSNEELSRANEDLNQFAHSASHDLQEPLRTVSVYSQLLRRKLDKGLGAEEEEYINYILRGANRMEALIKDLLAYNQASGISEEPPPVVDANMALEAALANLDAAIEASGGSVVHGPLPHVRMRSSQLTQLFQNLIGNAIKYRGEEIPVIRINAASRQNDWLFSVEDNGIGIEDKYKEQIFGIFKRLHTADEYSGTGMGLAICKRIVERAGGRIWTESQPRRGSIFFFTLPSVS